MNGSQEVQKPSFGNRARTGTRARGFAFTVPTHGPEPALLAEPSYFSRYGGKKLATQNLTTILLTDFISDKQELSQIKEGRMYGAGDAEEAEEAEEESFDKREFKSFLSIELN